MADPGGDALLTFEHLKWAIALSMGGYIPLVSAIGILYHELMKSKANETQTLNLVLPLLTRLADVKEEILHVLEELNEKLEDLI